MARSARNSKPYSRPTPRNADDVWKHDLGDNAPSGPRLANRPSTGSSLPSAKLLVNNLHYEVTEADLTAIFGQIGTLVNEPRIRYDRSGRSSGTAYVTFETVAEATRAKRQYDGILAKGQPMSIVFDMPPRGRSTSAPTTGSLLSRINKGPLLGRLSKDDSSVKTSAPPRGGVGPIRNRGGRGKPVAPKPARKAPKTMEDLDKELDAFMGDATPAPTTTAEPETDAAPPAQDVEMV
ncbi:RRM domain-containing protein [Mycena kentingensis (nom. inval.)]|nr:RRM domain-containing protein [Mycena kentingensis (nom. inval.)]